MLCRRFAQRLGVTVASVDYRLAPELLTPSGRGLLLGVDLVGGPAAGGPGGVAIGGASAGGGLAAALALFARDRGEDAARAQLLVYPMLDDRTVTRKGSTTPASAVEPVNNNSAGRPTSAMPTPTSPCPPATDDLSGLPPAWMGVGTLDLFHDEDLAYAERLKAAGVPCDVEVVKGAFHGFDGIVPKAEVSQAFFDSQCAMLRRALAPARLGDC